MADTKKTSKKPAAKPKPKPARDLAAELAEASPRAAQLRAAVKRAENELRAARSISTIDHRIPKVAAATDKVAQLRADLVEADALVAELKTAIGGVAYRTAAVASKRRAK